jgi:hypothetical protein
VELEGNCFRSWDRISMLGLDDFFSFCSYGMQFCEFTQTFQQKPAVISPLPIVTRLVAPEFSCTALMAMSITMMGTT